MDWERNYDTTGRTIHTVPGRSDELTQVFMQKVYMWMTFGLFMTAVVSYFTATSQSLITFLFVKNGMVPFFVLVVIEFGIVLYLSSKMRSMNINPTTAIAMFFVYSALNGLTIAPVLMVYTKESVATTFLITAGMFGGMSIYGAVTKRDLTELGSFLRMGLWGLLIAMLVNLFMRNNTMSYAISGMAIIIFTGLVAYDTNKLRALGSESGLSYDQRDNLAVFGALILYLDFINLFLHLLRFLGKRK